MQTLTQKTATQPKRRKKPADAEIDIDDAQIEPPKDDAFTKQEIEDDLDPSHYRG
jgi:hypothetical protein